MNRQFPRIRRHICRFVEMDSLRHEEALRSLSSEEIMVGERSPPR